MNRPATGEARPTTDVALPRWLTLANPVVMALNRLGLAIGTQHILSVRGRTNGKPRRAPA